MDMEWNSSDYTLLTEKHFQELRKMLPGTLFFQDEESRQNYGHDETEDLVFKPELVVIPSTVLEISLLMKWCSENHVPITPRGGGTGLSGGALPVHGGILLSLEKLNQILDLDERNQQATVESGVITQVFMDTVEEKGLYYPIDPSSKGSSFLGGNIAHGSGGPRVVKYGTIRDYVLNLEVVLPSGEIIWTGANTIKFSSGYNLTQLMIGSEGTLGIITKIVLKLIPKPSFSVLLLAGFTKMEMACEAVSKIFNAGFTPSALEFMERKGLEWVMEYEKIKFNLKPEVEAMLMIELDGTQLDFILLEAEKVSEVLYDLQADDVLLAETNAQKEEWWKIRRKMPESVKANSIYKEEDTVVPRAELASLIRGIKKIGHDYGFQSVCYGHAGDGNLHINIIKGDMAEEEWSIELPKAIKEIFELTVRLNGTLSGEHGIGWVQKTYMPLRFNSVHLNLLKGIKNLFDPLHILNPGKMVE